MTKLCECGCGKPTPIAKISMPYRGYKKGQPQRFITGHNSTCGPLSKRFWLHVDKNGPTIRPELGPCWVWKGTVSTGGYAQISENRKTLRANRVAWFLTTGKWPNPFACHKCDNPLCVRFSHLFEGTNADNAKDMAQKGRCKGVPPHVPGELNGNSKLREEQITQIRNSTDSQRTIAKQFGVSQAQVQRIKARESWRDL